MKTIFIIIGLLLCTGCSGRKFIIVNKKEVYFPLCTQNTTDNLTKLLIKDMVKSKRGGCHIPDSINIYYCYTINPHIEGMSDKIFEKESIDGDYFVPIAWSGSLSKLGKGYPFIKKHIPSCLCVVKDNRGNTIAGGVNGRYFFVKEEWMPDYLTAFADAVSYGKKLGIKWYVTFNQLDFIPVGIAENGDMYVFTEDDRGMKSTELAKSDYFMLTKKMPYDYEVGYPLDFQEYFKKNILGIDTVIVDL